MPSEALTAATGGEPGGAAVPSPPKAPSMGRSAAVISGATMLSRVLGVVREQILAALFGTGPLATAYGVAFLLPNLLRDMLGEGVLTAAFVPTFADTLKRDGKEAAFRLASAVLGLVALLVGALAVLGMIFAPELVALFTEFQGTPTEVAELTELSILAARILFPFLPLMSLAAVVMGALNAQERYGVPAVAPAVHNVVAIAGGSYLLYLGLSGRPALVAWAATMLFAGFAQLTVQLPQLYRTGFRLRIALTPECRRGLLRIGRLMAPATLGLAALQVNLLARTWFASQQDQAIPWLNYAFRIFYLPLGVFGVAVATVTATRLALHAAGRDIQAMRRTFDRGLRLVAFLTIPSTVGLVLLREPIVRLLFEHGRFEASSTEHVGMALALYALGLYAYSGVKVAAPAFYALDRTRVPVIASMSAVAANLIVSFALFPSMGYRGLAIGMSVAAVVNFAVLFTAFRQLTASTESPPLLGHAVRVGLATVPCGAVAWGTARALESALGHASLVPRLLAVVAPVALAVTAYAACCSLLRLDELSVVTEMVRRRLRKSRPDAGE